MNINFNLLAYLAMTSKHSRETYAPANVCTDERKKKSSNAKELYNLLRSLQGQQQQQPKKKSAAE